MCCARLSNGIAQQRSQGRQRAHLGVEAGAGVAGEVRQVGSGLGNSASAIVCAYHAARQLGRCWYCWCHCCLAHPGPRRATAGSQYSSYCLASYSCCQWTTRAGLLGSPATTSSPLAACCQMR